GSPVQMGWTMPLWLSLRRPTAAKLVLMPAVRLLGPAMNRLVRKEKRFVLARELAGTGPSLNGDQTGGALGNTFFRWINVQLVPIFSSRMAMMWNCSRELKSPS